MIVSNIEKRLSTFMLFWHSMIITQQVMHNYNTTVYNNNTVALNLAKYVSGRRYQQHATQAKVSHLISIYSNTAP